MTTLAPIAPKLAKLIPMLSSDQPGEVLATVAAIRRTLEGAGANLHDLAAALTTSTPPRREIGTAEMLAQLRRASLLLSEWELRFVASLTDRAQRSRRMSPKQIETLRRIYEERIGSKP